MNVYERIFEKRTARWNTVHRAAGASYRGRCGRQAQLARLRQPTFRLRSNRRSSPNTEERRAGRLMAGTSSLQVFEGFFPNDQDKRTRLQVKRGLMRGQSGEFCIACRSEEHTSE